MPRRKFRIALPIALSITLALTAAAALTPTPPTAQECPEGEFPEGWEARFDREGMSMDDLCMVTMLPGLHITTGPRLIAYHPDSIASGDFRIESTTFLFDPEGRREAFGFFIGGSDLQGPDQRYTYFLLREGGEFLVKARSGTATPVVQDWTAHTAIVSVRYETRERQHRQECPRTRSRRRRTALLRQRRAGVVGTTRRPGNRRRLRPPGQPQARIARDDDHVGGAELTAVRRSV